MAFKHLGRADDAAAALERLLARVDASTHAHDHRAYAADNLAHLYEVRGRWAEALAQAAVAEEAFLALRGADSPEPWAVAGYRAGLQYATGDLPGAHERYAQVLAAQQRIYTPADRRIMNTQTSLARVALAQGDDAAARSLLDAALPTCEREFGVDHAECPLTWQLWGELQARQGNTARGVAVLREAIALRQAGSNPLPRAIGLGQLALARALCEQQSAIEGRALVEQADANLRVTPPAPLDVRILEAARETCRA
jgi:tetratricopeptide (TPR) repeat protein